MRPTAKIAEAGLEINTLTPALSRKREREKR